MNKVLAIVGLAAVVITGFLINRYGQARYDAGYLAAGKEQADAQDQADAEARKDFNNVSHETNGLDNDAVDRELRSLGIMRQPEDR